MDSTSNFWFRARYKSALQQYKMGVASGFSSVYLINTNLYFLAPNLISGTNIGNVGFFHLHYRCDIAGLIFEFQHQLEPYIYNPRPIN